MKKLIKREIKFSALYFWEREIKFSNTIYDSQIISIILITNMRYFIITQNTENSDMVLNKGRSLTGKGCTHLLIYMESRCESNTSYRIDDNGKLSSAESYMITIHCLLFHCVHLTMRHAWPMSTYVERY